MTTDAAPEGVHVLRPEIILYWPDDRGNGYCLVREIDDEEWCMGVMQADGSVYCWATYGTDLGRAIRAL
jgi:hypothetical protein